MIETFNLEARSTEFTLDNRNIIFEIPTKNVTWILSDFLFRVGVLSFEQFNEGFL